MISVSTAGSNSTGNNLALLACQRILAVGRANFASTRICWMTDSAMGGSLEVGRCGAVSPLTPALSPLRGEGGDARRASVSNDVDRRASALGSFGDSASAQRGAMDLAD